MRRANGEGTIYRRRDGRFEAAILLDGRRSRRCFMRQADARRWLTLVVKARDDGVILPTKRITSAAHFDAWLVQMRSQVRYDTWRRYEQFVRLHILPVIGKVALAELKPQHIQEIQNRMLTSGASPTSVKHAHTILHHALQDALRWDLVTRNVVALVAAPKWSAPEMKYLDRPQASRFLAAIRGDRLEALFVLAISTGMRQGELFALRWKDVDLEAGYVKVIGSLGRGHNGPEIREPKTSKSRRRIELAPQPVAALRQHRTAQAAERLAVGPAWAHLDLVFCDRRGGYLAQNTVKYPFQQALARAGLARIRFHDLRHTAATLLLSADVHPKVVSEMLGHAGIKITLDVYAHVLPTMQREAARVMGEVLGYSGFGD